MTIVDQYLALADAWGAAMDECDSPSANALHDRIQAVYQEILQAKQESVLFDRVPESSDAACLFIASHLKDRDFARAITLYKRLVSSTQPFIAMSAQQIMREMTLHRDPL